MSYLVTLMELKGHVRRSSHSDDGRLVIVSITASGRVALNELLLRRADLLARYLSRLSSDELAALEAAVPVLGDLILALEGRTPVGATR
jgi:DNA-binding MarR family transcriptional regulator